MLLSSLHFLIVVWCVICQIFSPCDGLIAVNSTTKISSTLLCIEFSISYKIIHMDGSLSMYAPRCHAIASVKSDVNFNFNTR